MKCYMRVSYESGGTTFHEYQSNPRLVVCAEQCDGHDKSCHLYQGIPEHGSEGLESEIQGVDEDEQEPPHSQGEKEGEPRRATVSAEAVKALLRGVR